jgi:DNA-binding Lrp family transcriptional regulator
MEELLEILEKDAKIKVKDLAKLLGKKEKAIESKIKDLEKKGIILGYKAVIDKDKLSRPIVRAIIEVQVIPRRNLGFDYIAEKIYKFPEVKSCYLVSGTYDLLVIVEGEKISSVSQFIAEKLAPMDGIKGTATHFMLKKYKEDGVIFATKIKNKRLKISI